jgi:sec-independent protein translocase protein TatA
MPLNLGPMEMIFILVVLLVLFGAKRLPELGSGLGKGIREFKRSMREINTEIERPEDTAGLRSGPQNQAVGSGTTPADASGEAPPPSRES